MTFDETKEVIDSAPEEGGVEEAEVSERDQRAEQLKRVEQALRELEPVMEQFKNAERPRLEENFQAQVAALEEALGEKLGQESLDLIHLRLVEEVLTQKDHLVDTAAQLEQVKETLKPVEKRELGSKEKFGYRLVQIGRILQSADVPQLFREFGRSNPSEEAYEAAAVRLNAFYKDLVFNDKRLPHEKLPEFKVRLQEIANELNASVKKEETEPQTEPAIEEQEGVNLSPEEQAEGEMVVAAQAEETEIEEMAGTLPLEQAAIDAKAIDEEARLIDHDDDDEEVAAGSGSTTSTNEGKDSSVAGKTDEEIAAENTNETAVAETIANLVYTPEAVLGDTQTEGADNTEEKSVLVLLDALRNLYVDQDELIKRLKNIFTAYKIAWAQDRRTRPDASEAAHKKMAMEDIGRDLPATEAQALEKMLAVGGEDKKLTKEHVLKGFFDVVEQASHINSPETDALEAA